MEYKSLNVSWQKPTYISSKNTIPAVNSCSKSVIKTKDKCNEWVQTQHLFNRTKLIKNALMPLLQLGTCVCQLDLPVSAQC